MSFQCVQVCSCGKIIVSKQPIVLCQEFTGYPFQNMFFVNKFGLQKQSPCISRWKSWRKEFFAKNLVFLFQISKDVFSPQVLRCPCQWTSWREPEILVFFLYFDPTYCWKFKKINSLVIKLKCYCYGEIFVNVIKSI